MEEIILKYLSPAKAAADLGVAVKLVKHLVATGELNAMHTLGGQLRISTSSIDAYRKAKIKKESLKFGTMCILHRGNDLDPALAQSLDPDSIQLISHPFELLDIEQKITVLFIDARYVLLQETPLEVIEGLQKKYKVLLYNSQVLPKYSPYFAISNLIFLTDMISASFIAGYEAFHQLEQKGRLKI